MKKYPILTVIYHETKEHFNMARQTWLSFPADSEVLNVVNKTALEMQSYKDLTDIYGIPMKYLFNDKNCLAKAWNKGLKEIFKEYDYCFVSGLDSISPKDWELDLMIERVKEVGFVSANCTDNESGEVPVKHGDGSFSFFCISKKLFEDVGDFDENFKPAYFEDNDYLERMWQKVYEPIKMNNIKYYHVFQGTVKAGEEIRREYSKFMQKNLEYFKKKWGKVPDHLDPNIRFN